MAKFKVDLKTKRLNVEKERVGKFAKWLLFAFCAQFIFYLILVNVIPFGYTDANGEAVINSFYTETWRDYKDSGVRIHQEGNGIKFIYWYNIVLLCANLLLGSYYMINIHSEEHKGAFWESIKLFLKKNKGLMFLLIFMIIAFISSLFAGDKFRSFVGCYNLRDGYFSFMFYGSMLVNMLFLGFLDFEASNDGKKKKRDSRRVIVDLFLITFSIISAIMLLNYNYLKTDDSQMILVGLKNEPYTFLSTVTSATFNNSNHFAYVLSISVVAAACMFVKEKSKKRNLYLAEFVLMLVALIINNTFGAYIGVTIALVLMVVHSLVVRRDILKINIVLVGFLLISSYTVNNAGENIVKNNINYISDSIAVIFEDKDNVNSENDVSNAKVSDEISGSVSGSASTAISNSSGITDAGDAGSGRWRLWVVGTQIALENPILGVGLENMLYAYGEKGVNEGRSHNLIVQLAGTLGIPAMICYVIGMAFIFFTALKYFKDWDSYTYTGMFVIVSYLISSLTGNSGFYTSGYFYIFVGFVVLYLLKKNQSKEIKK